MQQLSGNGAVALAVVLLAAFYIGAPLLIRFVLHFEAHPRLDALDVEQLDFHTAQFLLEKTRALAVIGFHEPVVVHMPSPAPNVACYLILVVDRSAGDNALVIAAFSTNLGAAQLKNHFVEFGTRFETGELFDTLNSRQLLSFPPGPQVVRTQVPTVTDPKRLYQLHQFVMQKHGARGRKVVFPPGEGLEFITKTVWIESYERQVQRGWLYYDQKRDVYRPTLLGACLMTWGEVHPIKALRKLALHQRARRILHEFDRMS